MVYYRFSKEEDNITYRKEPKVLPIVTITKLFIVGAR